MSLGEIIIYILRGPGITMPGFVKALISIAFEVVY